MIHRLVRCGSKRLKVPGVVIPTGVYLVILPILSLLHMDTVSVLVW